MYLSLKVYATTRRRELVERIHRLGLGIPYDRTQDIVSAIRAYVSENYACTGLIRPRQLCY